MKKMLRICMIRYYRKAFEQEKTANRIFHDKDGRVFKLLSVLQLEFSKKSLGGKKFSQPLKGNSNFNDEKHNFRAYGFGL